MLKLTNYKEIHKNYYFYLLCIVIAGMLLRLYKLNVQSLWFDELGSLIISHPKYNFFELIKNCAEDVHPPLFQIILWGWIKTFSYTEFYARLLPALIGTLGIGVIYFLGKEINNKFTGIIASLITALNYFHLYYSQDCRSYGLLFLLTTLSFLLFLKNIRKTEKQTLFWYALISVLLLYTHYFALIVIAAQIIILVLCWLYTDQITFKEIKKFIITYLLTLGAYLPWLPVTAQKMTIKKFWVPPPAPDFFYSYFTEYFGSPFLILLFSLLLLSLPINLTRPSDNKTNKKLVLSASILVLWTVLSYLIPYVRSYISASILLPRYTIITLPAIITAVALSISLIRPGIIRTCIILAIITMSLSHLIIDKKYYTDITKMEWKKAVETVSADMEYDIFSRDYDKFQFYFDTMQTGIKARPATVEEIATQPVNTIPENIWVLSTVPRVSGMSAAFEYLITNNYKKNRRITLIDAKCILYKLNSSTEQVHRMANEILAAPDLRELKIDYFEGSKKEVKENIVIFPWNEKLSTNKYYMKPGSYSFTVTSKGRSINNNQAQLKIYVNGKETGRTTIEEQYTTYKFDFSIETETYGSVDISANAENIVFFKHPPEIPQIFIREITIQQQP